MKTEKAVILSVLACASLVLSYWLGYESGWKARSRGNIAAPLAAVDSEVPSNASVVITQPKQIQPKDTSTTIANEPLTYASRDPAAKPWQIDLTPWYNAPLSGAWNAPYTGNDLSSLPTGLQSFDETQFDVRGLIHLGGSFEGGELYPRRVDGIRVGLKCKKLDFLHNARRTAAEGAQIGSYVIRYAGGDKITVPIRFGETITDWWASPNSIARSTNAVVVWEGENPSSAKKRAKIILVKFTWENPQPDKQIQSLDFVSEGQTATPFLIAITAEP